MGIADNLRPVRAAEQLVHRPVDRLALDVPQGNVNRADGAAVDLVCREERGSEHVLPQAFGLPGVRAHDQRRKVVDGLTDGLAPPHDACFAKAVYAGVSVHADHEVAAARLVPDRERTYLCDFHVAWTSLRLLALHRVRKAPCGADKCKARRPRSRQRRLRCCGASGGCAASEPFRGVAASRTGGRVEA
jgi:hypothetical protein